MHPKTQPKIQPKIHPLLKEYYHRFVEPSKPVLNFKKFFTSFSPNETSDIPYLYNIEKATARLETALDKNEKICIYSDYDTDAVTACATMYWGLIELGFKQENIHFYAPDRFTEGYGMNTEAIQNLSENYNLIISVDCGINSVEEAKIVLNSKADLIITDHHHLTQELPNCVAVINPRLQDYYNSTHPEHLSKKNYLESTVTGVGVSWFTLVWLYYYLLGKNKIANQARTVKKLNQLLALVAIGTIADCQSILDSTNRILTIAGLKIMQELGVLNSGMNSLNGLKELLIATGLNQKMLNGYKIQSQDIAFTLSPILNSSGRMSHAKLSIEALIYGDKQKIQELFQTNEFRKLETKNILKQVEAEAKEKFLKNKKYIFVSNSTWSKGLIGLLASRLVAEFDVPVIVVELPAEEGKLASASLRAPDGFHLPNIMKQIQEKEELFEKFGGHPQAAGFSAKTEFLQKIEQRFHEILTNFEPKVEGKILYNESIVAKISAFQTTTLVSNSLENNSSAHKKKLSLEQHPADLTNLNTNSEEFRPNYQQIYTKIIKKISDRKVLFVNSVQIVNENLWQSIENLEPYGFDFPFPNFLIQEEVKAIKTLAEGKHYKLELYSVVGGQNLEALIFNPSKEIKTTLEKAVHSIWILGKPQLNYWQNKIRYQIITEEIFIL